MMTRSQQATVAVAVLAAAGVSVTYSAVRGALDSQPMCAHGIANAFDWIPDQYHDEIQSRQWGGAQVDMAPHLQAAIDTASAELACRSLYIPAGLYPVLGPLELRKNAAHELREVYGGGSGIQMGDDSTRLLAMAGFVGDVDACTITADGECMLAAETWDLTLRRIFLDGNHEVTAGIELQGRFNTYLQIREVQLSDFDGGPAIVGGGVLQGVVERSWINSPSSMPTYCVDLQASYTGYYHGAANFTLRDSFVYCPLRLGGSHIVVENNQFEFSLVDGPEAVVVLRDGLSATSGVLRENYFELSGTGVRTEPFRAVAGLSAGLIEGNGFSLPNHVQCNNAPNPKCLEGSVGVYLPNVNNVLIWRNVFRGWETAIHMGARTSTWTPSSLVYGNTFKRVGEAISGANASTGIVASTNNARSGVFTFDPDVGFNFIGRAVVESYDTVNTGTAFWLGSANAFRITTSDAITHNEGPAGMRFALHFDCSPCGMLDANKWGLAAQGDVRPELGDVLSFLTDRHGKPHEIGDMSERMAAQ